MTARMDATREALASLIDGKGMQRRKHDAALAEVEEWERDRAAEERQADIEEMHTRNLSARAEAAEEALTDMHHRETDLTFKLASAEAERDKAINERIDLQFQLHAATVERNKLKESLEQARPIVARAAGGFDSHRPPDASLALDAIDAALAAPGDTTEEVEALRRIRTNQDLAVPGDST